MIIGLLLGIVISLAVALWLNRLSNPFVEKGKPVEPIAEDRARAAAAAGRRREGRRAGRRRASARAGEAADKAAKPAKPSARASSSTRSSPARRK